MTANANFAIAPIAMLAVSMTVVSLRAETWTLSCLLSDICLYLFGILASWVVAQRFNMSWRAPAKKAEAECIATPKHDCSCEHACDVVDENLVTKAETEAVHSEQHDEPEFAASEHVATMQKQAAARNIGGTVRTFRSIQQSGGKVNSLMYNIVLQAWIDCGNVQAAEDWMEDIKEAGMTDKLSFDILIKALVEARALSKAKDILRDMRKAGLQPCIGTFNELLTGFVRGGRFNESLSLLDEMHAQGLQPNSITLNNITELMNGSRKITQTFERIRRVLTKFDLMSGDAAGAQICKSHPVPLPRLAAVISQAQNDSQAPCAHEIHVTGSLSHVKACHRTLKQHGFLNKQESCESPLDGHWETDHGLTVVVEGKIVRWGGQRASMLRYTRDDRSACTLQLYGETARGELVTQAISPDARKMLRWDNGDVWQSYDGRVIGQDTLFAQSMTKTLRDKTQDAVCCARADAMLKCVSKQALGLPAIFDSAISQFLGNDLYYVRVHFSSKWNPSKGTDDDDELPLFETDGDICDVLSRRHPQVALRHCWAERTANCCGQRSLVNGREVDEDSFSQHVGLVRWS